MINGATSESPANRFSRCISFTMAAHVRPRPIPDGFGSPRRGGIKGGLAYLRGAHDALRRTEHIYMVLVSVVIGLLGGLGAVGFRLFIRFIKDVAWHDGEYSLAYIAGLPWWWKLRAPTAGGLVVGAE